MTISADQQAALEKAVVKTVFFLELAFQGGTQYMCSSNVSIVWNGHTWLGLGILGSISSIVESDDLASKSVTFTLSAAEPSWLALAAGPVESYAGRKAKLYRCPLDDSFALIGTPERCWQGVMDMVTMGIEDDGSSAISLKCETGAFSLKRGSTLRMNAAQQKQRHPADTGFDHLAGLLANPVLWVSKKFQAQ
ncbi:MAG: hypothetical protein ACRYGK_02215 [Janthinobacterium lividum]